MQSGHGNVASEFVVYFCSSFIGFRLPKFRSLILGWKGWFLGRTHLGCGPLLQLGDRRRQLGQL